MKPLDFTYVVYDETSIISEMMAGLTFAPILLLVALASVFAARREIETGQAHATYMHARDCKHLLLQCQHPVPTILPRPLFYWFCCFSFFIRALFLRSSL